jgi:hypothetical protein
MSMLFDPMESLCMERALNIFLGLLGGDRSPSSFINLGRYAGVTQGPLLDLGEGDSAAMHSEGNLLIYKDGIGVPI